MQRTLEAIAGMADEAHVLGATAIVAVGTAGMRLASNRDAFVEAVRARTGVEIEVISGEEESRLAYLAVLEGVGLGEGSVVVFDTGGGSSQFTFGTGDRVDERFSVNVGAVRFTERFGLDQAVSEDVVASAQAAIAENLASLDGRARPDALVALGGVVTNLAAVKHDLATYDSDVVQGTVLAASGGRPPDRALPDAVGRRAARGRRAPAEARRGRARRRLHRARGDGEARQRFARGERPGPPPRGAQRPVRSGPFVLAEPALLLGPFEQAGGHRDAGSLSVDEVVHEHVEQGCEGRFEPEQRPVRRLELDAGRASSSGSELKGADLRVPERFGAAAAGRDQPLVRHDDLGGAELMPARHGGRLRLGLLRGVVGKARCARDGEADRAADQEERRSVLLVLSEVAGDGDRPDARVRNLARPELDRRCLLRHRGATGESLRPLMGVEEALVEGRPPDRVHARDATSEARPRRSVPSRLRRLAR